MIAPVCGSGGPSSAFSPPDAPDAACGRPDLSPTPCFNSAISSSVSSAAGPLASVGIFRLGFFFCASSKRRRCLAFKSGSPFCCYKPLGGWRNQTYAELRLRLNGAGLLRLRRFVASLCSGCPRFRRNLCLPCPCSAFCGRLTIALLQVGDHHCRDEFLLAMVVELDD